jgi:signal-transduction protein with cAMP-binding, CBS, and nucleotidyltransferase domain
MFRTLSIRRVVVMHEDRVAGILSRRDLIWHALKLRGQLPESQAVRC